MRTLVVVMGEFGRSPKINAAAGRDHWNFGYTLFLAGGGIKAGHIYGASDKIVRAPSQTRSLPPRSSPQSTGASASRPTWCFTTSSRGRSRSSPMDTRSPA